MYRILFYYCNIIKSIDIFFYDSLHCFYTSYCSSNNDGLFIAWYLFNAFLNFLIVFLLFNFSHSTYLGFIAEFGRSGGSKLTLFQRTNFPNTYSV